MRTQGTITNWDDARGFGFITSTSGGPQIFLHIRSLRHGGTRPALGSGVIYETGHDERGRPCAKNVVLLDEAENVGPAFVALVVSVSFFAFLGLMVLIGFTPQPILWSYCVFSACSFLLYAVDKYAAKNGAVRVPERILHLSAVVGGWPGALYAQQLLRHKSSKQSFRLMFWITVILNVGALLYLMSG